MTPQFKKIFIVVAVIFSSFFWFCALTANAALDWKDRLYDNSHFMRPSGVGNFANPNLLYTISSSTFNVLEGGFFNNSMAVGDVDGDGKHELILSAVFNNNQYLYIYNGATGQLKNSIFVDVVTNTNKSILSVTLADMDNDGMLDIITTSDVVKAYKGNNLSVLWQTVTATLSYMQFPTVADIDGNGTLEVLAPDWGSPSGAMHLFNGQTGAEIFSYTHVISGGSVYTTPLVADINNDGDKEIVYQSHDINFSTTNWALDKNGNLLWSHTTASTFGYVSPIMADFDNDGTQDILTGNDEAIILLNASTGAVKWTYSTGADSTSTSGVYHFVSGVSVGDINNDGVLDIVFGFNHPDDFTRSGLFVIKGSDGTLEWSKTASTLKQSSQLQQSPVIADIDNDGNLEILFEYLKYINDGLNYSDYNEAHIDVYDGAGNKEFSIDNITAPTHFVSVVVADINDDGILDIIINDSFKSKIFVYTGGGQANQRITVNLTVPSGGSTGGGNTGGGPGGSDVPPIIFAVASSTSFTTATISWSASDDLGVTASSFVYGPTISYGNTGTVTGTYKTDLSGLAVNTMYYFKISVVDTGNHTTEYTGAFSTLPPQPDTTPPIISNKQIFVGITTATIQWNTNELADSQVIYGLTNSYGSNYFNAAGILAHSALLSNLTPNTIYHFKIISTDSAGNSSSTSDITFTTQVDNISPPNISNFILTTTTNSIVLSWTNPSLAGTPDFSGVKVVRKIGSASVGPGDGAVVYTGTGENFIDTNILVNIDYFYTIFSFDTSNNYSSGIFRNGEILFSSLFVPIEICGNGLDDDANGYADCADSACGSLPECVILHPPAGFGPEICGNSLDDDNNGATDCADSACAGYSGCMAGRGEQIFICNNGIDDDGDGKTDYPADSGCDNSSDNDEYNPPESSVPSFAQVNLTDLEFLAGNQRIKLELIGGVITGLSGASLTVVIPEEVLASSPKSMVLRVGDTDQHQFVYNTTDKTYYTTFSFYGVGLAQAYLEIDYGSGQFDSVAFKLNSLPWGQAVDENGNALAGARISLRSSANEDMDMGIYGQINPIISDVNGSYGWMVPNGSYQIFLRKDGYYDRLVARGNIVNNVENGKLILIAKPQDLALAIDPNASLQENIANVAKNLATQVQVLSNVAVQKIQDAAENPEVEKVNEKVVVPAAITMILAGAAPLISWLDFLPFMRLLFLQPLMLLGFRKREKWGLAYNSLNKLPIDLAIVRLISLETNRVAQSKVTDSKGHFVFMVEPGKYRIEAQKNNFIFPSKFLEGYKSDGNKADIYHGEIIEVTASSSITAMLPMDPVGAQKKPLRLALEKFGRKIQFVLSIVGVLVTAASLYISPKWYIAALLAVHILFFFIFRRLAVPSKTKNWGIVYDEAGKTPITRVIARLFNSQFNKLVDTQITDSGGRYHFMAGDAKYFVTYEHKAYQPHKTDIIDLEGKDAEVITVDVKLKKN